MLKLDLAMINPFWGIVKNAETKRAVSTGGSRRLATTSSGMTRAPMRGVREGRARLDSTDLGLLDHDSYLHAEEHALRSVPPTWRRNLCDAGVAQSRAALQDGALDAGVNGDQKLQKLQKLQGDGYEPHSPGRVGRMS